MNEVLKAAKGQYRVLYALLAGCGPMRIGEALGLEIGKHISEDCRTLHIRQKAKRGIIQDHLKTKAGERDVDLCSELSALLREYIGNRTSGLLFCTRNGKQICQGGALRDSLHPILASLEHVQGGFNIFRRYRRTFLDKTECPEALKHFWSGHSPQHVSERYIKLFEERAYRLEWAEKVGLGFELPTTPSGLRGLLIPFKKTG
jgi:integrase